MNGSAIYDEGDRVLVRFNIGPYEWDSLLGTVISHSPCNEYGDVSYSVLLDGAILTAVSSDRLRLA